VTHHNLSLVSLCLCYVAGCAGRDVDLDHRAPASSAPMGSDQAVVFAEEGLAGVWVDDRRLYWLTRFGTFQSCVKTDCEQTRLSYAKGNHEQAVAIAIANGHVYWTLDLLSVFSCAAEGCETEPAMVVKDPGLRAQIYAHQDHVYWSSDVDFYRCPASGCAATPEIAVSDAIPYLPVFDDARVYWHSGAAIMSAPADGSGLPELVFEWDPSLKWGIGDLSVAGGFLYWRSDRHAFRCAIASCNTSAPTLLVTWDLPVYNLTIDASAIYWRGGVTDNRPADTIYTCPLERCEQPTALTPPRLATPVGVKESSTFAIDATEVYWLDLGDDQWLSRRAKTIRKTAK
jgi:hypothetical protein